MPVLLSNGDAAGDGLPHLQVQGGPGSRGSTDWAEHHAPSEAAAAAQLLCRSSHRAPHCTAQRRRAAQPGTIALRLSELPTFIRWRQRSRQRRRQCAEEIGLSWRSHAWPDGWWWGGRRPRTMPSVRPHLCHRPHRKAPADLSEGEEDEACIRRRAAARLLRGWLPGPSHRCWARAAGRRACSESQAGAAEQAAATGPDAASASAEAELARTEPRLSGGDPRR